MLGFILAIIAGAAMSIQGVFNTRLSQVTGTLKSNAIVQGTAFLLSIIILFIFERENIFKPFSCNKLYLTGGIIGIVITITVMLSIKSLTPTVAISTILVAQLTVAALIDALGLFESPKTPFGIYKYIGIALMIAGILIFKHK